VPKRSTAELDDLRREAHLNLLLAARRTEARFEDLCRAEGVTFAQYPVLFVVCLHRDSAVGVPTGAIADGLVTRTADVTRLVDRLTAAGLVERLPSPNDRRQVLVRPTTAGRATFDRLAAAFRDGHHTEWAVLDPVELRTLNALLARVVHSDTPTSPSATPARQLTRRNTR
jgi:DNA-binding MarR family transcriptional regulator